MWLRQVANPGDGTQVEFVQSCVADPEYQSKITTKVMHSYSVVPE